MLQGTSNCCGSPQEKVCPQGEENGAADDGHGGQACSPGKFWKCFPQSDTCNYICTCKI